MNKTNHILTQLLFSCFIFFLIILFVSVIFYQPSKRLNTQLKNITSWTMETQSEQKKVNLPLYIHNLPSRTPITLITQIKPVEGDYIYLKTVYSPIKVYADETLIFSYGQDGTYPAFLLDPPTKVKLLPLPETGHNIILRIEYLSPSQRNSITLHPICLGTSDTILINLFSEMGFSLFFSTVMIALGIILFLIFIVLIRFEKIGISFFWLGLFSILVGIWIFGECNLTGIFIKNASLLYIMAFIGLFTFTIPLIKFGLIILELHHKEPLKIICLILEITVCLAVVLQILGIVSLSKIAYFFHILIPLSLCIFSGCILFETFYYNNETTRCFLLPMSVLAVFSLLELANYYIFHFGVQVSFFFQLGVLIFLIIVSILCGHFIHDTFLIWTKNHQLLYEVSMVRKHMNMQKERNQILSETAMEIRRQRHDLRHQLVVIRNYIETGEKEKLIKYLDKLNANIPVDSEKRLCENEIVNSVALYYYTMAKKIGIESLSIDLDIPKNTGRVLDSDLCIIVGNLLENAITACGNLKKEKPFIRMKSRLQYDILTITMDNNFQSVTQSINGDFQSQKSSGGIGLISICSVAEKYGGIAKFEVKNGVFLSSVYIHLV